MQLTILSFILNLNLLIKKTIIRLLSDHVPTRLQNVYFGRTTAYIITRVQTIKHTTNRGDITYRRTFHKDKVARS